MIDRAHLAALREQLSPLVHFGTSTWTYPGWKGLVYEQDYPASGAAAAMLAEYARWPLFTTVGIDSTFYRPPDERTLAEYAEALPPDFRCGSKVWDRITVHTHTKACDKARAGQANPDFLNAELFEEAVLDPWRRAFAAHAGPLVLEFQTIQKRSGLDADGFAERLDAFFSQLPRDLPMAVELRNAEFLVPAYFAVLREHGVGHVFNSWTRMPPIGEQLDLPGAIGAPFVVARALLRPGRYYAQAVEAFKPYDRIQDPLPELRADLVRLITTAVRARIPVYAIVNNRAEGCAPLTIAAVAEMLAGSGS